jgi:hypothetical protein
MDMYRVTSWGKAVGIGVTGASFIEVSAVCKTNALPDHPYYIANELIAAELGRVLKLPVPPGFIIEDSNGTRYFASLGFNLTGVALPPILPDEFAAQYLAQIGGIVAFDTFIANPDRHGGNISATYGNQGRFNLFDHSHALLGPNIDAQDGQIRFRAVENQLGIGGHCLKDRITDDTTFLEFLNRIESIPDYFVRETVSAASDVGLSVAVTQNLTDFLLARRGRVRQIIAGNKGEFPGIRQWRVL